MDGRTDSHSEYRAHQQVVKYIANKQMFFIRRELTSKLLVQLRRHDFKKLKTNFEQIIAVDRDTCRSVNIVIFLQ